MIRRLQRVKRDEIDYRSNLTIKQVSGPPRTGSTLYVIE